MLVRNIIFARLLTPDNFSIALTFGVALSFFEYLSSFGHELLMQRSEKGDDPRFQAAMHTIMVLRGIFIALLIVLIAPAIPNILNVQTDTFNYALLAVVPFINGFAHLDPQRAHRQNDYQLSAKIGIIADTSSIFVALISISLWENYWAFYASFVFRHSISTLLSHRFSSRQYRLGLDKDYFLALWKFGLPLILIGALKYFGTEVDKVLIARYSGLAEFTLYFLTIMVTANAANLVSVGLSKIFIRRISLSSDEKLSSTAFQNGIVSLYLVLPILFTITLFGEHIIPIIFGQQYSAIPFLFPTVIILVSFRQLSHWLNQIVVGRTDTKLMLYADLIRVTALAMMLPLAVSWGDTRLFALTFAVSEVVYILFLSQLVSSSINKFRIISLQLLAIVAVAVSSFSGLYWLVSDTGLMIRICVYVIGVVSLVSLFNSLSDTCWKETRNLAHKTFDKLKA